MSPMFSPEPSVPRRIPRTRPVRDQPAGEPMARPPEQIRSNGRNGAARLPRRRRQIAGNRPSESAARPAGAPTFCGGSGSVNGFPPLGMILPPFRGVGIRYGPAPRRSRCSRGFVRGPLGGSPSSPPVEQHERGRERRVLERPAIASALGRQRGEGADHPGRDGTDDAREPSAGSRGAPRRAAQSDPRQTAPWKMAAEDRQGQSLDRAPRQLGAKPGLIPG